jgi:hypothetical protein
LIEIQQYLVWAYKNSLFTGLARQFEGSPLQATGNPSILKEKEYNVYPGHVSKIVCFP